MADGSADAPRRLVDSTENRVVCLKGFEDDGYSRMTVGRHYPKAAAQCGFARIFDKKVERASREKSFELSSSDLT